MANWRHIALIAVAAVAITLLLLFIKGVKGGMDSGSTLNARLEQIINDWTVKKLPVNSRVINLVIGVSGSDDGILDVSRPLPDEESMLDKLKSLFARRKLREAQDSSSLIAQEPGAVTWTFDGFSKADEKAVIEELAKGIVKAHDAEAELNIVAKGDVGAAVLKAVKRLEGQERGGVKVGVNSLVIMGMDRPRLRAYDPVYFSEVKRPLNVASWMNVYGETLEVFSGKYDGRTLPSRLLEPRMSSSGLSFRVDALALAVIGVFSGGGLEEWVARQDQLAEQEEQGKRTEAQIRQKAVEAEAATYRRNLAAAPEKPKIAPARAGLDIVRTGWRVSPPIGFDKARPDWGVDAAQREWRMEDGWVRWWGEGQVKSTARVRVLLNWQDSCSINPYCKGAAPTEGSHHGQPSYSYRTEKNGMDVDCYAVLVKRGACVELVMLSDPDVRAQALESFSQMQRSLGPSGP